MSKKVKKQKTVEELLEEAVIPEKDHPYKTPENWILTHLETMLQSIQYGYTDSSSHEKVGPKYLRITDIQNDFVEWGNVPSCNIDEHQYQKYKLLTEDIVVARTGATTGKSFLIKNPPESVFASYLIRLRTNKALDPKYLWFYMRSPEYWKQIMVVKKGSAQPGANAKILGGLILPVPPINEQKRIADKVDRLLNKIDEAKRLFDEAKETFELRRAAILDKAFRGELTEEWREAHSNVESADNLLKTVAIARKEKYKLICAEAIQNGERKPTKTFLDKIPNVDGKPIDVLPNTWALTNVGFLAHVTKLAGFEYTKYFKLEDEGDIPVIRAQNVQMGKFVESNIKYISKDISDSLSRSQLHGKEILMVFIGAGTGNVCMTPTERRWHLAPNVAKITVDGILPEYLNYFLQSPAGQGYIKSKMKATAQQSLSMGTIREVLVHLPPLEEQYKIVDTIKKLDEALYKEKNALLEINLESVKQSILSKAFRGELETNNSNEKSAIELLKEVIKQKH
ncbi:restriction endonuclease subunit S [Alkalihalobacillus sp. CinArs1]|uniref:restriction endonuclease subunit S n=1 Tax=Alkalihalobacillus sp. CinArs1 TaxID=2995314 RepID=UPI0022DDC0BC|nr:restriction endonuclease subunit S [Alkalihalobacillus sp. CinArs1]